MKLKETVRSVLNTVSITGMCEADAKPLRYTSDWTGSHRTSTQKAKCKPTEDSCKCFIGGKIVNTPRTSLPSSGYLEIIKCSLAGAIRNGTNRQISAQLAISEPQCPVTELANNILAEA